MEEKEVFELSLSQEVSLLQTKYTLFKQVINILSAMSFDHEFDKELMTKAINLAIERNDCLRLYFFKDHKQVKQYFRDSLTLSNIPCLEFKTKEEFDKWYKKYRARPIKYLKGVVSEFTFIKNYDGKYLVFLKICHMVCDIYGINIIFQDISNIYKSLREELELPKAPGLYKPVLMNDIKVKNDQDRIKNNDEFFNNYLNDKKEPTYGCVAGLSSKIWAKRFKKGKRSQKMFFLKCDTEPYKYEVRQELINKVIGYASKYKISLANIYFFTYSITTSLLNEKCEDMIPLELSNCRGTLSEKKCAGSKVQSVGCYTHLDYDQDFDSQMKEYSILQSIQYKHLGFSDTAFEMMLHKYYKYPLLGTYYGVAFSLIPFEPSDDYEFQIYSNGKGALGCYLAMMMDVKTNKTFVCYDVQKKVCGEKEIVYFHNKFMDVLDQLMDNPNMLLKDIK